MISLSFIEKTVGLTYLIMTVQILMIWILSKSHKNRDPISKRALRTVSILGTLFIAFCGLHHMISYSALVIFDLIFSCLFVASLYLNRDCLSASLRDLNKGEEWSEIGKMLEKHNIGHVEWRNDNLIWWDDNAAKMHGFEGRGLYSHQDWENSVNDLYESTLAMTVGAAMWEDPKKRYAHTVSMPDGSQILGIMAMNKEKGFPTGILLKLSDGANPLSGGGNSVKMLREFRETLKKLA